MKSYPNINMEASGKKLQAVMKAAGMDVKTLQAYLHLSCPQPIYRWFNGQVLPSVDHLYALSRLFHIHMEELLVPQQQKQMVCLHVADAAETSARLLTYYERLRKLAA